MNEGIEAVKNVRPVMDKQYSFVLSTDLFNSMEQAAYAANLTVSAFIRIAIAEKIVRMEQK